ncbi:helix-turn-helix transcriptional regulator [Tissierella sp.]|uniref:helix-turn-helix transcriptional regulator n=1 Tax=Tissierella sp. TaxID=41274 RepID=UPI00286545E4|nr:helix-turn-helix transcriptional regulator [Tissierella sp.]MDR7856639.1 helix-turn-helix transcriptional regulator [Tissierella sp.]
MSKAGVKFDFVKEKLMKDEELALRVGTQKSNISRLESGSYNPSLDFLVKVAKSLGKKIYIEIK